MLSRTGWNSWYTLCFAITISTFLSSSSAISQPQCYWEYHSIEATTNNDGPCGNYTTETGPFSCCASGDTCLGNQICKGPGGSHQNGSGYYLSGCTDETLANSTVCTTHCTTQGYPDIVYNTTTELWACCNVDASFNVNCKEPTADTWSAPAPSDLHAVFTAHSSTSSASATSPTSSPTSSNTAAQLIPTPLQTPTEASPNSSHSGLIIVIILSIAGGALVLGLVWSLIRSRRKRKELEASLLLQPPEGNQPGLGNNRIFEMNTPDIQPGLGGYYAPAAKYAPVPTELAASAEPSELAAADFRAEMGSGRPRYG